MLSIVSNCGSSDKKVSILLIYLGFIIITVDNRIQVRIVKIQIIDFLIFLLGMNGLMFLPPF